MENKKLSELSYSELLIKCQSMINNLGRKKKQILQLEAENEMLRSGRYEVNRQKVERKEPVPITLKKFTKGMPKQLRKLNGYLK